MDVQPVTRLARAVVTQIAPGELPLFEAMSRAYAADSSRARTRRGGDEALGFGFADAAMLVTPVVLIAVDHIAIYLAEELGKSLTHQAAEAITERISRLFRREPSTPPLTHAQISRIRDIAIEAARAAALTEPRATILAETLVSQLTTATPVAS